MVVVVVVVVVVMGVGVGVVDDNHTSLRVIGVSHMTSELNPKRLSLLSLLELPAMLHAVS